MNAPLSEQQLAEIAARAERVRAMRFTTGLNAASGHFDTPVERELYRLAATCWNALQAQLKDSDALLAELQRLRPLASTLETAERTAAVVVGEQGDAIGRLEARVAELEAERHSTNEALDEVVKALAEKGQQLADLEARPLAWAEQLDLKSLDNLLITLAQAADYEPMAGAIEQIHEVLASFRNAVEAGEHA